MGNSEIYNECLVLEKDKDDECWRRKPPLVVDSQENEKSTTRGKIREIFMPALSSIMTEGKIVSWIKSESDVLSKGESAPIGAPICLLAKIASTLMEAQSSGTDFW
ncbi:putative dihydrolipoyllysine-residue acetyltransferase [Helianthus anomalus]